MELHDKKHGGRVDFPTEMMQMSPTFGSRPAAFQARIPHTLPIAALFPPSTPLPPSATKCHQFILARGPISSFTANIPEMHFSSCYHLTVLISTTPGTQYCLHILLCGIPVDAKKSLPGLWKETFTLCFMRFPRFVAVSVVVKTAVNQKSTTK